MEKDITICFQTSSEIHRALEKIAEEEKQSVCSVVESIIHHHLKNDESLKSIFKDRRFLRRKMVSIPAYIGDPRWQRREFEAGTIQDISFGGIRLSVPKGTKMEIKNDSNTTGFKVIFTLPHLLWPININYRTKRVVESAEEVHIGATLENHDFYTYSVLQKCLTPPLADRF
jgi:hypothetical protein